MINHIISAINPIPLSIASISNSLYNLALAYDTVISSEATADITHRLDRSWMLNAKFCQSVINNCMTHHDVAFYADELNITSDYLYKIVTKVIKMTPKEMIEQQLVSEIKTLLIDTDLTIKEIADRTGFEDPSYMCRFFRRMTHVSTGEFKNATITQNEKYRSRLYPRENS